MRLSVTLGSAADGRYIVFLLGLHAGKGSESVWRADASGGNLKQLSQGKLDNYPVCAPDSRSVYFMDGATGKVMQVPIDGGTAKTVSEMSINAGFFDISPDGRTMAFATIDHAGGHEEKLALVATDTGQLQKQIEFQRPRRGMVRFARDGKSIVYPIRENNADNLWQQPLDGSAGKQLTSFKAEHIWDYRVVGRWQQAGAGSRTHGLGRSADTQLPAVTVQTSDLSPNRYPARCRSGAHANVGGPPSQATTNPNKKWPLETCQALS